MGRHAAEDASDGLHQNSGPAPSSEGGEEGEREDENEEDKEEGEVVSGERDEQRQNQESEAGHD